MAREKSVSPARGPQQDPMAMGVFGVIAKSFWTIVIWAVFIVLILGPLLTIVLFSLTDSVFEGVQPTTLRWYKRIVSEPALYFPLLRTFEVALMVVAVQLLVGCTGSRLNRSIA